MSGVKMISMLSQKICAPVSLAVNSVLLQLVCYKSPKQIGAYKYLLCFISIFEIVFAFLNVLMQPEIFSHSTVFLVVARTDRLRLPTYLIFIVDALCCGMFGMTMTMFAVHFIYRYLVVTGNSYVKTITCQKVSVWLGSMFSYGAIWILVVVTTLNSNPFSDSILIDHFLPGRDLIINEVTYVGPNYYKTDINGSESLNFTAFSGMVVLDMMVAISFIVIIIFAVKCYKCVSEQAQSFQHSKSYRDLQSQLLNSLVAQIIIPAILLYSPAMYLFTCPIFHLGNEIIGNLFCTSVSIFPVLDPLPTMFMVQHYRNALIDSVSTVSRQRRTPKRQQTIRTIT